MVYAKFSPNTARMMNAAASDRVTLAPGQKLSGLDAHAGMIA